MFASHALIDVTRAQQPESCHSGVLAIANADGELLGVIGDRSRLVFPRSSIKIIQALNLIESGAADHFDLTDAELALVCASHSGSPYHVALADHLLQRIKLGADSLACGGHLPLGEAARNELLRAGRPVGRLHNNCSGKHAGMVLTASHLGAALEDYEDAYHVVQQRIRTVIEQVCEHSLDGAIPGVDGCGVPNWPLPIEKLAIAFARIVSGEGFEAARTSAFERLLSACWAEPRAMAGDGRLDTTILSRFPGDVYVKTGAEGVYCGGIRSLRLGFALKIDDGASRASQMAVGAIIAHFLGSDAADLGEPAIVKNSAGMAVGDVRAGAALTSLLSRVPVESKLQA